jgi:hypothetical protein
MCSPASLQNQWVVLAKPRPEGNACDEAAEHDYEAAEHDSESDTHADLPVVRKRKAACKHHPGPLACHENRHTGVPVTAFGARHQTP